MRLAIAQKFFQAVYPLMDKEDKTSIIISVNYADWDRTDLFTFLEFPNLKQYNGISVWKYKVTRIYFTREYEYPELYLTVSKI